ncbi:MAG TPA: TolC family protein [Candidatus Eremiobacteraceae bacterium]|nr:TolC family protein [Candidatus Eremiobacteraceae bacterium]
MKTQTLTAACLVALTLASPALAATHKHPAPKIVARVASPATPAPMPTSAYPLPAPTMTPQPNTPALSLTDVEKIALARSPQLEVARAAVDQAQSGIDIARSAELPNVSAQASTDRSKSNFRVGGGNATAAVLLTSNGASANLRQLILDGGRVANEVQSARYSTDAARLSLTREIQTVLLTVAQQYFASLQARYTLRAALDSLHVAQVQEKLVEAQYRVGVAARADVLTAQLPVAQAQLAVTQAQNGEASNSAALLATIGLAAQTPINLKDDTSVTQTRVDLNDAVNVAMQQRADLQAAQANERAAEANVRAAKLARFPVLAGTATDGTASTSQNGKNYSNSYSFGASLSFPILDGGLIHGQTEAARAQQRTAQANLINTQLTVSLNIQQAILGLQTAQSALTASNVELAQARTVVDVTNAQYKAGVTTLPLLLNAQNQLTRAETDQINALYGYKVAQQNLYYAEGAMGPVP